MTQPHSVPPSRPLQAYDQPEDVSFIYLWHVLIRSWRYWTAGIVASLFIGLSILLTAQPHVKADVIIAPSAHLEANSYGRAENIPALRLLAERLGGGVQSTAFVRFENIFNGVAVADILMQDPRIQKHIGQARPFKWMSPRLLPTSAHFADYLERHVHMQPVHSSSLRRIEYFHPDPDFAVYFLQRLHHVTDNLIRQQALIQTQQRTAYLQNAIAEAQNPDHRRALTSLLLEQQQVLMLASAPQPYAAAIVEPAAAHYKPSWPNPRLIFPTLILAGILLGVMVYGIRHERLTN